MTEKIACYDAGAVGALIRTIRCQKVILDSDLARVYGVETKVLNKAVSRNRARFPDDFAFKIAPQEVADLRFQIGTSNVGRGGRRSHPWVFTEHGAIMAANVLRSCRAVQMSVFVVRAFVKMGEQLLSRSEMEQRLLQIENILLSHDDSIRDLYEKLRPLLLPPPEPEKKPIGFQVRERRARYGRKRR